MQKIAFIFPGQGAQKAGMGQDFYNETTTGKNIFDKASRLLNLDMPKLCFEPNEKLDITEYTQAAMVTVSIAMMKVLNENGIMPDVAAGLSLGEYCALVAAGVFAPEDAILLVRQRGILMQEAVPLGEGAMAAILSLETEKVEEVIQEIPGVQIANYNCPGQIVISGRKDAVEEANAKLLQAGAKRAILLNVSGPFHSDMLREAGHKLEKELASIEVKNPVIPYVSNVTASYITSKEEVKPLLVKQVYSPVKWQQSVENMIRCGVTSFVEIGPGRTLAGFIKKINREAKVFNVEKLEDIAKVVDALAE